jgi:hypothetical protein
VKRIKRSMASDLRTKGSGSSWTREMEVEKSRAMGPVSIENKLSKMT